MKSLRSNSVYWRAGSLVVDCAVAGLAFVGSFAVVYNPAMLAYIPGILEKTAAFTVTASVSLVLFGLHRASWRFVSLPEMMSLAKATTFAVLFYTVGAFFVSRGENIPRSVPILTGFFMMAGLAGARILYRLAVEGRLLRPPGGWSAEDGVRTVLLLGYTASADGFIRAARNARRSSIAVVGILDDESAYRSIQGVRVLGTHDDLERTVHRLAARGTVVNELVIAEPYPSRALLADLLARTSALGLKCTRVSDFTASEIVDPDAAIRPRPIEISDLLGRPEYTSDVRSVASLIEGKVVLVTGAGGSIGSELVRQIAQFGPSLLILTDNSEHNTYVLDTEMRRRFAQLPIVTQLVSVRDTYRLRGVFLQYKPDVVFHAAALKHVPLVEANPIEGIKTNLLGTRNAVDAALASGVKTFVMISTDKAVNPTSVMGATKRAAEAYCQAVDVVSTTTRFKTVRFGNVLGSNGSVVPLFQKQIMAGGPVTVTHPQIVRYFMTIPEAVRLVLHASAHDATAGNERRGKIVVLDMGEPVRILDLAERMIQLAGLKPGVDIEVQFTGPRPGEKLFEELFDPSEVLDPRTDDGYVVASPRIIDRALLLRTLTSIEKAADEEDVERSITLLSHIVPEYRRAANEQFQSDDLAQPPFPQRSGDDMAEDTPRPF